MNEADDCWKSKHIVLLKVRNEQDVNQADEYLLY